MCTNIKKNAELMLCFLVLLYCVLVLRLNIVSFAFVFVFFSPCNWFFVDTIGLMNIYC